MSGVSKEVLDEYINETREMCERVSLNLGLAEKSQLSDDVLNSIYRDMHSIKGSSHLFGFQNIGGLAHVMESALDPIRQKLVTLTPQIIDVLFIGLDLISKALHSIVSTGAEDESTCLRIKELIPRITEIALQNVGGDMSVVSDTLSVVDEKPLDTPMNVRSAAKAPSRSASPQAAPLREVATSGTQSVSVGAKTAPVNANVKQPTASKETTKDDAQSDSSTIRIPVSVLDSLMNRIGELVLIRNQVLQFADSNDDDEFYKLSQRLNLLTSELQNDVMKTRMQPIGSVLQKFHRVVRDLSKDLGKRVDLKVEGGETELDKTLIEAVKDPLTHLIRNCVDHGIESIEDRLKSKKSEVGKIAVRSFHEGGQVVIEIIDDGRGLHPERIGRKAVEKGVITEEQRVRMSDRDLQALIFAPGFSTAEKVSNISGRGVGMDVVKTNIEKIGGAIELQSVVNHGTTVRLKIPLTLAIIPALLVKSGEYRFAIPQVKVVELVRLEKDRQNSTRIEILQGQPVFRLRGKLLPIVDLGSVLKITSATGEAVADRVCNNIVIVQSENGMFGLLVDQIVDSSDIVVKPLGRALKDIAVYSGATIMGDGSIALILDVLGVSVAASITAPTESGKVADVEALRATKNVDTAEYLLVDVGVPAVHAIPLCLVNRLEEFSKKQIEFTGNQRIIRYRNQVLPLISVFDELGLSDHESENEVSSSTHDDLLPVIVMSKFNRLFGLEVRKILDVVEISADIDESVSDRMGIHGSIIRGNDVVVVIDALALVDAVAGRLGGAKSGKISGVGSGDALSGGKLSPVIQVASGDVLPLRRRAKLLLAEDTSFFRKHIKRTLEDMGFVVQTAVNGEEALQMIEASRPGEYSAVISDIEMPLMDGFDLAKKVRSMDEHAATPMIALTTRVRKVDVERGREVGFTYYLEKFNPEELVQHLDQILVEARVG